MVLRSSSSSSSSSGPSGSWSSSSSSPPPSSSWSSSSFKSEFTYDVFLSFRGEDTRKTFIDHLYAALKQAGFRTFLDDDAMDRGRPLPQELAKAIHQSQVSIIVFSKEFATSKWCLNEAEMIMEEYELSSSTNKREVVPVFYNIDPTDVRFQTGCFEEAFTGYDDEVTKEADVQKKKELSEKVEAWRICLRKAGFLTGIPLKDGYEAKFISRVVKVIQKKLNYNALYIDGEKLVGIAENIAMIESWMQDTSPDALIFVIDGIGGIGKTTIAKCVYNSNLHEYDCSCFLADIKDASSQPTGMLRLQSQLLSKILKSEKEETVWNEYEGTTKIIDAMCNKKILMVLDDVTTLQQLNALLGPQRFYPGSKIIVTTRHKWLITNFEVDPKVLTVKTLSTNKSIELLSLHAFDHNKPKEPYIALSLLVGQYCMGLPFALKVWGLYLRRKSIDEWNDTICKLRANPHREIQNVLQLSYESLENENDKDVFLQIACFVVGGNKDYIVKLLAECNRYPITEIKINLSDTSLLHLQDGEVGIHQLEMGKEVVRLESPKDPQKRRQLWRREDCIKGLQENVVYYFNYTIIYVVFLFVLPYLAMVAIQFLYAAMYIITMISMKRGLSHWILVFYGYAIATLVIAPFALVLERNIRPKMTLSVFVKILLLGLLEVVIGQNMYFLGMSITSATHASAIVNVFPAFTFVMGVIFRQEEVKLKCIHSQAKIHGTAITMAGAVVMILYKGPILDILWYSHHTAAADASPSGQHWLAGTIMVLICTCSWSGNFIIKSMTLKEYPLVLSLTFLIHLAGTVEGGIVAMIMEPDPKAWALGFDFRLLASVYIGILSPGIAYYVQGVVCRTRGLLFVIAFNPLCMIITAVLGAFELSEQLHLGSLLGAIIIVTGLYSVLWGKRNTDGQMSETGVAQELPVVNDQANTIDAPTMVRTRDTTIP